MIRFRIEANLFLFFLSDMRDAFPVVEEKKQKRKGLLE